MRSKNALILAAVSLFALTVATTTNAAYVCRTDDGVKYCGNELGFAPSAGGEADPRDQHSGDREPSSNRGNDRGNDSGSDGDSEGGQSSEY